MAAASLAALGACAPTMKGLPRPQDAAALESSRSFGAAPVSSWPGEEWWRAYNDPQLDALIAEALKGSPDLKAAVARMNKAAALARVQGADGWPSVSFEGDVVGTRQSLNEGFPPEFQAFLPQGWNSHGRIALDAQYELDFFGRNRAAFAAATSEAEAARAEAAAARLQLASAVAIAYADLARFTADRAGLDTIVRLRQDSVDLVKQRFDAGLEHEGQVSQSQSELSATKADIAAVDAEIARARNQLAALLGAGPDRGLAITVPAAPALASAGLPGNLAADLIGRRPDLVAARARAEAAADRVHVARAAFYPNVNLRAVIGFQALGLDLLTDKNSQFGSYGPAVSLPIFNGGRLKGQLGASRADYEEAVALYDQTLANALRDVADALSDRKAVDERLAQSQAALDAAENSYRVARLRYEGGLTTYLDVLTVENALSARRRAVSGLQARAFAADIELIRALGGGYAAQTS